jgi:hypothetical protein
MRVQSWGLACHDGTMKDLKAIHPNPFNFLPKGCEGIWGFWAGLMSSGSTIMGQDIMFCHFNFDFEII